jgi:hypothetical protein
MKKYVFLYILGLVLQIKLHAQTDQVSSIGIGALSDSSTVMVNIGQPFCSTLIGFATLVDNRRDSLLCYNVGEMPDITVTPGVKTRFACVWKDHKNVTFDCIPASLKDSVLDITLIPSGDRMVFEYNSDINGFDAFQLDFMAMNLNDTVKQTVTFNPVPVSPQEYKIIEYKYKSTLIDSILIHTSDDGTVMDVIGKNVIFENESYPFYHGGSATSIKKLSIYAANLIIRDPVKLPGCEVTVYCENLRFERENAYFNIQPNRANGTTGENAKDMHIYAGNFYAPGDSYRFYLAGGKGSDETPGIKAMGGGNGGNFISNLDLRKYANLEGGYTGDQIYRSNIPTGPKGEDGLFKWEASYFGWLHPIAVRFALQSAADNFIHGQEEPVYETCEKYINLLDAFINSSEYDTATAHSIDLTQLYHSFTVMHEKLTDGYDYFGNPKSWAPLLSFESNLDMYNQEKDFAIKVLYLHYWITKAAKDINSKKEAAHSLIKENEDRIAELLNLYNKARENYLTQNIKFDKDDSTLVSLYERYEKAIDSLNTVAQKMVSNGNKWKGWMYTAGNICSYIPALSTYAPLLKGAAQFDYGDPFSENNGKILSESFTELKKEFEQKSKMIADAYSGNLSAVKKDCSVALKSSLGHLSPKELKKDRSIKNQLLMPADEVEAKFNQLKASCPQISNLASAMEECVMSKAKSWEDLSFTIDRLDNTSAEINQLLTSISAMVKIENQNVIDMRAVSLLDEMKNNAWASLLKYHYYLARAYQYRFLKPYPGDLQMQPFFEKIEEIAVKGEPNLEPDDLDALNTLFEEPLKRITDTLYYEYNSGETWGNNSEYTYTLDSADLNKLNSEEGFRINLYESGVLKERLSDYRITNLDFTDVEVSAYPSVPNSSCDILVDHSGKSNFISPESGKHYMFDQYCSEAKNYDKTGSLSQIGWGIRYNLSDNHVSSITMAVQDHSLIKYILDKGEDKDILIFTQPAAWGDLSIKRYITIGDYVNVKVNITKLTLKFNLDSRDPISGLSNVLVQVDNGLSPIIKCSTKDVNGLSYGRGTFVRTFKSVNSVEFTAPETYGNYKFDKWDRQNNDGAFDSDDNNKTRINTNNSYRITARYKLAVPILNVPDTIWAEYNDLGAVFNIKNDNYCNDIPMDWSLTESCDWININDVDKKGTENGSAHLQLTENADKARTGVIHVTAANAVNPFKDIVVVQKSNVTSVHELPEGTIKAKLYPNPARQKVYITFEGLSGGQDIQYSIVNMQGRLIHSDSQYVNADSPEISINIDNISSGVYFIIFNMTDENTIKEKLMIN